LESEISMTNNPRTLKEDLLDGTVIGREYISSFGTRYEVSNLIQGPHYDGIALLCVHGARNKKVIRYPLGDHLDDKRV
jgi:hypothetical protein